LIEGCGTTGLERSSTRHQIEDEHNDGEDQKDVNPAAERVAADESYDPEDEKDNRDCPKHFVLLDECRLAAPASRVMVFDHCPSCGKLPGSSGRLPVGIKYEMEARLTGGI
jgi:hypothetical protein